MSNDRTRVEQALGMSATVEKAAVALGMSDRSLRRLLQKWSMDYRVYLGRKAAPAPAVGTEERRLKNAISDLRSELLRAQRTAINDDVVRREIIGLKEKTLLRAPPDWDLRARGMSSSPGTPSVLATDWHWGESVDPKQVNGLNEYSLETAHRRARAFFENTVDLLKNHMVNPTYPGLVLPFGGDMLSGDIHEELTETNELPTMPALLDIFGVLVWGIGRMADEFGKVFCPAVSGNHPRNTRKPRMKARNFTNFDWLLYNFLAKRFEDDDRVKFFIPDGSDALYAIYGHRYLLTHGDQFHGGDGIIGAIGPIFRGDAKKRARNSQVNLDYDTLICGHWHQQMQLSRLIVGGTLKGLDEYGFQNNFPVEAPQQPLWLTHPERGITFHMPVFVDEVQKVSAKDEEWVSWRK